MDWYIVIKTIKGRRYKYRQKTWREGKHVRTRSEYIGPEDGMVLVPQVPEGATTLPLPFRTSFREDIYEDAFVALTDKDAPSVFWKPSWEDGREGATLVEPVAELENLLANLKVRRTVHNRGAFYSPLLDEVNLPPRFKFVDRPYESATHGYYATLMHELVHWTKGRHRAGRSQKRTRIGYAREELVAELGAITLMKHFGLKADLRLHTDYFGGWLARAGREDVALAYAKKHAARAVQFILKRGIISE